jgi:signal transduction histidine kinase
MRERAAKLGGTLEVSTATGRGTVLRVVFPV